MAEKLYIPIILGTGREGRMSEKAAHFILAEAENFGLKTEILDAREYAPRFTDDTKSTNMAKKYAEKIIPADGIIIVSPEYNHAYPGELKMMLDQLYHEYEKKPVGICGVSSGRISGARMIDQLRPTLIELGLTPIRKVVHFPRVQDIFKDNEKMEEEESYKKRTLGFLEELAWYARALKNAKGKS